MKAKAVIFDLDGTLLDTLQDLGEAMNAVLREHAFPVHPVDAYRHLLGEGMEALVRQAMPEQDRNESLVARLMEKMQEEYDRRWQDHTQVYSGVPEMLDELERRGLPKAILTNHQHHFMVQMVEKFLGAWSFTVVRGVLPGAPHKPDPDVALKIAREMELSPQEIVFVGDSGIDMLTARAAGMDAAGVLWGYRDATELLETGARKLLAGPHELINILA